MTKRIFAGILAGILLLIAGILMKKRRAKQKGAAGEKK